MSAAAQFLVSRKEGQVQTHFSNMLIFPMLFAVLLVVVFLMTFPLWQPHLQDMPSQRLLPCLIILPLLLLFESGGPFLVVLNKVKERNLAVLLRSYITLFAAALLYLFVPDCSIDTMLWAYILGYFIAAAYVTTRIILQVGLPLAISLTQFWRAFKFGVWVYLSRIGRQLFALAGFFFVVAIDNIADAGVYSVAAALTTPMMNIPFAVQTILFPKTSAQTDQQAIRSTPLYYRQVMIVMAAIALPIAIFSQPILLLFGEAFTAGQTALIILLVTAILSGANGILVTHILGRGKPVYPTLVTVSGLALIIALSVWLVPLHGMTGAALATALSQVAMSLALLLCYKLVTGGSISSLFAFQWSDLSAVRELFRKIRGKIITERPIDNP